VLAQVVGLFTVTVAPLKSKGKVVRSRTFIVQRNLRFSLPSRKRHSLQVFDLKGAGKSRRATVAQGSEPMAPETIPEEGEGEDNDEDNPLGQPVNNPAEKPVLWDQNFREWTDGKPLCLRASDLQYLEAAVWNDTHMLSRQALVDYSLLLAAVVPNHEGAEAENAMGILSLGIIDYLRLYTWDKQLESKVKQLTKDDKPTVIEQKEYADRFRSAMGTFFVAESP